MKVTPRFMIRAALVLTAGGVIGAFGACKDSSSPNPPAAPPPPPPPLTAPAAPTMTASDTNKIALAWTYADATVTGFRLDRCSGDGCTNFAQVGANLAGSLRAYTDSGLTNNTKFSYRIRALRGADTSAWSPTLNATTGAVVSGTSITMIGAGEITTCSSAGNTATAALVQAQLDANPNTIVFTAGNNMAASGSATYSSCFGPTWGKFKDAGKMRAALGDADFTSAGGSDQVYSYFGTAAGAPKGYYSFDAGSWHVIVLNTTASGAGKCAWSQDPVSRTNCTSTATPELDWLATDLAANTKPCLMAISWERRLYTSSTGTLGRNSDLNAAAEMLYAAGLDILVSAKDQQYERFPKLGVDGAADPKGFSQFIVGTGGRSLAAMHQPAAGNPVAAQFGGNGTPDSWGVIKFTLNDNSYGWEFVGTDPARFSDKSTTPVSCN